MLYVHGGTVVVLALATTVGVSSRTEETTVESTAVVSHRNTYMSAVQSTSAIKSNSDSEEFDDFEQSDSPYWVFS